MKRFGCLLLCLCMVFCLVSCGSPNKRTNADGVKTTLMIYMVGSDLEAKGGAGTKDIEEMIASGVDLSSNRVLVYAGGSKKWHNDNISVDDGHTILQLTADGMKTLETRAETSMGEAETLAYFLNYAYDNFVANNYALVLWDHGNGPLIGYGKDMLHENDTLTLLEMKAALEKSPFSADNKLAWVGFDACLMSSVELACVWQNYADYLVASQEIEPSFGWNYSFLQQLGKVDAPTLIDGLTQQYMDACQAYYQKRNYAQRDTTLACIDLSKLNTLKTALEDLFRQAAQNVDGQYNFLANSRANTRAYGRATTGSEYDLIDLADMAEQIKQQYPTQAAAVQTAIQNVVVHNVNNTTKCCGLSLYYPFYNKGYYEKTWGDVYSQLGVLPAYVSYLELYAKQWLKNDMLDTLASSTLPQAQSKNEFTLQLTQQQAETYADANFYVLQREGDQLYSYIYSSANVVKDNNVLTAVFDGNILYAKNDLDVYWIPNIEEHDTVGDYTRYSTYVNLTNSVPVWGSEPEGYQHKVEGHRFHISVNNKTKEIQTSALVPYDTTVDTTVLGDGKLEDADLSRWSEYYFLSSRHLYLQRDKNGTILPLGKWEKSEFLSANVTRVLDGVEFVLAPIPAGEYYLVFEVEDVQGNRYCSELLPIQSEGGSLPGDFEEESVEKEWVSGDKVELFSKQGVTVWLTTTTKYEATRYAFEVENKNNFDVAFLGHELMYNNVYCDDGTFGWFTIPAGKTVIGDGFDFGKAEDLQQIKDLESLEFLISVVTATGDRTLVYRKDVVVKLSDYAANLRKDPAQDSLFSSYAYYQNTEPVRGMQAKEQVVFEKDGLRCVLMGLGGNGEDDSKMVLTFRVENTSKEQKAFSFVGLQFDDVFINQSKGSKSIYPGTMLYDTIVVTDDDLNLHQISSAASVKLHVAHMKFSTLLGGGGFSETKAYDITLSKCGAAVNFNRGNTLIYEDESVQIFSLDSHEREYGGYVWTCALVNKGTVPIMLNGINVTVNGKADDEVVLPPYGVRCGGKQVSVFDVTYTEDLGGKLSVAMDLQFYDFAGEKTLWDGTTKVVLNK